MDSEALISTIADDRARQLGFRYWAYSAWADAPCERLWSTHNVPPDLWAAYVAACCEESRPDTPRSKLYLLPMLWNLRHLPDAVVPSHSSTKQLLRLVHHYGLACGLQLPLYASGVLVATLLLASTASSLCQSQERDLSFEGGMSLLSELHQLSLPHLPRPQRRAAAQTLTARELECLRWAALGKTTWAIGKLLDISEHTARFHLRNASSKLSASNRQQAVAKAIQMGYLS